MKKSILIAVTMVLAIIIGAMAVLSEGFKNWEVSTWFDDEETKTETPAEDETTEEETGTATSAVLYATSETLDSEETKEEKKTYISKVTYNSDMVQLQDKWTVSIVTYEGSSVSTFSGDASNVQGFNPELDLSEHVSNGGEGGYMGASFVFNNKKYSYKITLAEADHLFDGKYLNLYGVILSAAYNTLGYDVNDIDWTCPQTSEVFLDDFMTDFLDFYNNEKSSVNINNIRVYFEGSPNSYTYDLTFHKVCFLQAPEAKRGYELVGFYSDVDLTEPYLYNSFSVDDTIYALYEECELTTGEKIVEWLDENKVAIIVSAIIILAMGGLIYLIARMY